MDFDQLPYACWKRDNARPFPKRQLPGHCLAIMLAAWRGQSLVPANNVAGLERAFNPSRHPELAAREKAETEAKLAALPVLECGCGHPEHYEGA